MNTRKDYWRAVDIIRVLPESFRPTLTAAFIEFFRADNSRFDEGRFTYAVENGRKR
jgi:hypothetical protein